MRTCGECYWFATLKEQFGETDDFGAIEGTCWYHYKIIKINENYKLDRFGLDGSIKDYQCPDGFKERDDADISH